jgi:hypothetical protein
MDLAAAFVSGTGKGLAIAPLVDRERSLFLGPHWTLRIPVCNVLREAAGAGEQK